MSSNLATIYLSVLVAVLFFVVISVFRQILRTRKVEGSFSKLRNKLTKESGTAQEYYQLGSIYTEKKLYSQAITLFNKAIKAAEKEKEEVNIALIYNGLGYVYFAQEQHDLAIRNYKEAIKANPNYVTALNNLGHAYEKKKMTAQALSTYEDALKLEPKNVTAQRRVQSLRRLVAA
ncbi:MAG: tetratricopeptide repeat protein [Cyanobacteria bacterium P01_A01_bin.84]